MNQTSGAQLSHLNYRTPAVRHLAWMAQAPQLINGSRVFHPGALISPECIHTLSSWDKDPQSGPRVLTEPVSRRLGHYFEALYECLLGELLGWDILAKNLPVRSHGLTLGELDFLVRNPSDGAIEHHEIAVKFYLGFQHAGQAEAVWYGPNSRDRLDLKSDRLLNHQSRLTEKPETRSLLQSLGIPCPHKTRVFMPGYLFYPDGQTLAAPGLASANHLQGQWLYIDDADQTRGPQTGAQTTVETWVPLNKPHWLGAWHQRYRPDPAQTEEALNMVRSAAIPRLFAIMSQSASDGQWWESSRMFVVPRRWPRH